MNTSGEFGKAKPQSSAKTKRAQQKGVPKRKMIVQFVAGVDRPFLVTVILLLCMGTVMVFSSSYPYAKENFNDSYRFAKMQVIWASLGIVVMTFVAKFIDYHFLRKFSKIIMSVGILLLVAVLVMGSGAKGATRWIKVGPITIQPSEIMKFAVVLFFADYADKNAAKIALRDNFRGCVPRLFGAVVCLGLGAVAYIVTDNHALGAIFALIFLGIAFTIALPTLKNLPGLTYGVFPYIAVLGVVGVLLYLQPHLSGLVIIAAITFGMMLLGGTKWYYLATGVGVGVAGVFALAMSMRHSSERLKVWFDPFAYIQDDGWQPVQSLYAIGSGGFWGVGFGNSRQKHLYLPEPQNDYIFSIICEEMGFIGAFIVICVFAFFIYRGIVIGLRAPDRFSSMLVLGIIMHVGLQVVLNIAVVTNSIPSTGISLPFFSYGGSSLLILLAEMGIVLSVSRLSATEKTS